VNAANDNTKEEDNHNARSHEDRHEKAHIAHEKHREVVKDENTVPNEELFGHYACILMKYWWNEATLLSNWKLLMIGSLIFVHILPNYWS
jgi:hypothetical protein